MRQVAQLIAILTFVLATGQFTHAHEFEPQHIHVQQVTSHGTPVDDRHGSEAPEHANELVHCGTLLLAASNQQELLARKVEASFGTSFSLFPRVSKPGFDPPPPRA